MVFGVGGSGDKTQSVENVVMATPRTLRPWGVTAPYVLVEVEVNGLMTYDRERVKMDLKRISAANRREKRPEK